MKVLVTGGLGYIGSHTVVELVNEGHTPLIIDNLENSELAVLDRIESITGKKVLYKNIDLRDRSAVFSFFKEYSDVDVVIHFAAYKAVGESVKLPLKYYENNIGSLVNLLNAMEASNVNHFIFSSSCTVYGQAKNLPILESTPVVKAESPYGNTKKIGEEIIADASKSSSLKGILLRYFNPIGAHPSAKIGELPQGVPQNLVPFITQTVAGIRDQLSVFGNDYNTADGSAVRDYIHVVDLARAHVDSINYFSKMDGNMEVFNVGTGKGSTVLEVIDAFQESNNITVPYKIVDRRAGDVEAAYADNSKIMELLNWKPLYSLQDALKSAWEWEKKLRKV